MLKSLPTAGDYIINTEFRRQGEMADVHDRPVVTVAGHPDGPGHPQGRPVFALPGTTFGPELDVRAEFPTAGIYQQWAQFRLADGEVLTAPFTLRAEATENQGDREGESPWPAGGLRVNVREGTEIGAGSTLIVRRNDRVRTGDFAGFAARGRRRHDWRHWGTGSAGWTGC